MNGGDSKKESLKQKVTYEFAQFVAISVYLAFFFCAVVTYATLLLNRYNVPYYGYATALINAAVIGKVILIGEYARLGKRQESRPLAQSAILKALLFGLLVFAFHIVEEVVKSLFRGGTVAAAFHDLRIDELLARTVIIFCAFVPLFAFRELRRRLGQDEFHRLLFKEEAAVVEPRS